MSDWKEKLRLLRDQLAAPARPANATVSAEPGRREIHLPTPKIDLRGPAEQKRAPATLEFGVPVRNGFGFKPPVEAKQGTLVRPPLLPSSPVPQTPVRSPENRLDVVIGLDFGTRFTKVAYRIVEVDKSNIIVPDVTKPESALFKSVLFIDSKTRAVHRHLVREMPLSVQELPYLKLLLKDLDQPAILVPALLQRLIDKAAIKALSAFFLAGVLRSACGAFARQEISRLSNRRVVYSLNISLPADHYDDEAAARFQEVGAVALTWMNTAEGSADSTGLDTLIAAYDAAARPALAKHDVAVFPEIVAALFQFLRPDTTEGIHGFLDIGGGTVDGCIFRVKRRTGNQTISILAAKVAQLGTIVVAKKALLELYRNLEKRIESEIVTRDSIDIAVPLPLEVPSSELHKFTAGLVVAARDKMPGRTLQHDGAAAFERAGVRKGDRFLLHVVGGGAQSAWYRGVVEATHKKFQHEGASIMPYSCKVLEAPTDFGAQPGIAFERFVIAHGLSQDAANLENLKVLLPHQQEDGVTLPPVAGRVIGYSDSKEAYT